MYKKGETGSGARMGLVTNTKDDDKEEQCCVEGATGVVYFVMNSSPDAENIPTLIVVTSIVFKYNNILVSVYLLKF